LRPIMSTPDTAAALWTDWAVKPRMLSADTVDRTFWTLTAADWPLTSIGVAARAVPASVAPAIMGRSTTRIFSIVFVPCSSLANRAADLPVGQSLGLI
jgi:hypothetical protein